VAGAVVAGAAVAGAAVAGAAVGAGPQPASIAITKMMEMTNSDFFIFFLLICFSIDGFISVSRISGHVFYSLISVLLSG
jgi:hypothetical protein